MNCSYHTRNAATVQCNQCARALCPACDHRIRGFPFCQDCIVAGVEMLRYQQSRTTDAQVIRRKTSPFIATFLSLFVPGLGAAYNGQTSKAIVHFAIFASFFQMAVVTDGLTFFVLGVIGMWLFAAVDACRTAQLMRAGLAPDAVEANPPSPVASWRVESARFGGGDFPTHASPRQLRSARMK